MNLNPTDAELYELFEKVSRLTVNNVKDGSNQTTPARILFNECLALARRGTAESCPKCKGSLIRLRSQQLKQCDSCEYSEHWPLKDGQLPQIGNNRQRIKPTEG